MKHSGKDKQSIVEKDGMFKPKLVEKGCWNCALGNKQLGKICSLCIFTGKSRWRKKPSYRRKRG